MKQKRELHNMANSNPKQFWNEIKRLKGNCHMNHSISNDDFFKHFKDLFSNDNAFKNESVEDELTNSNSSTSVENLDRPIDLTEVKTAILSLKGGKSSGFDNLIPEIFTDGIEVLSPLLCELFNHIFNFGIYPESWTKGIIVPVPKKGNPNDVNNFRGIALTSVFSKLFSSIINKRLTNWAEENEILSDSQYGFRKDRSTVDCIFILNSLIDRVVNYEKNRLYCCFIDFKKAFDMVYRNGIFVKLVRYGCSCKIIKIVQSIYSTVCTCVRSNGIYSDFFESFSGVKQGETLSPLLFLLFINDMYSFLNTDELSSSPDVFKIDSINLFMLLFADDTVLFSRSQDKLQYFVDKLYEYCNIWGIEVNVAKSAVMVFRKSHVDTNCVVKFNNQALKVTDEFTYLGVTFKSNGSFYTAQKRLAESAMKALYSLNTLFETASMSIKEKLKLFDAMILPILCYGSEVWGFHKAPDIERIQLKFLKQVLSVKQTTNNAAVYGELGRFPIIIIRKVRILKYWFKIMNTPNSMLCKLFNMKDNNGNYILQWAQNIKALTNNLGLSYIFTQGILCTQQFDYIVQRIYDQHIQC